MPGSAHNSRSTEKVGQHFPRSVRLVQAEDYNKVFAEALRLTSAGLVLLYRANHLQYSRLGLAISKKHIKSAVQRNCVKRLIRESFRQSQIHAVACDIVILSRLSLQTHSREQIHGQLRQLWQKLNKHCSG